MPRLNMRSAPLGRGLVRATPAVCRADRRAMVSSTSWAMVVLPRRGSGLSCGPCSAGSWVVTVVMTAWSAHYHAAVHAEHLAGAIAGARRGQKGHRVGHVFGGAPAPKRDGFE